jgi:hypothetical protein
MGESSRGSGCLYPASTLENYMAPNYRSELTFLASITARRLNTRSLHPFVGSGLYVMPLYLRMLREVAETVAGAVAT